MSKLFEKSIKNNGIIKVNKKIRKVTDKSGHVLLKNSLLPLLWIQRSCKSTHPLQKQEQFRGFSVFCSGRNEFYDQNILHCRLLDLIIDQPLLFSDCLRHCWCFEELGQLTIPKLYPLLLKDPVHFYQTLVSPVKNKKELTIITIWKHWYLEISLYKKKSREIFPN